MNVVNQFKTGKENGKSPPYSYNTPKMQRFQGSISVIQFSCFLIFPGVMGKSLLSLDPCLDRCREALYQGAQGAAPPAEVGVESCRVCHWARGVYGWLLLIMATSLLLGKEIGFVLFPPNKGCMNFCV